jgi:DNA repair protein REV1
MPLSSEDSFSKYFPESELIELLQSAGDLPGGLSSSTTTSHNVQNSVKDTPGPRGQKRHRSPGEVAGASIASNAGDADPYVASKFGEFGQYVRNKRSKLQIQNNEIAANSATMRETRPPIFNGVSIYVCFSFYFLANRA